MTPGPLAQKLADEMDEVAAQYEARFAGKPRNTRNPEMLRAMIERTAGILSRIEEAVRTGPAEDLSALQEAVRGNLQIYQAELVAILDAREAGPAFAEAAELSSLANAAFGRYHRHFAGKTRASRDLHLMSELIDDLDTIATRMGALLAETHSGGKGLGRDLDLIRHNQKLYSAERAEIEKAQQPGPPQPPEDEASLLANLANQQIQLYKVHFAGRSRLTRRPALLERIIDSLQHIHGRMLALSRLGLSADFNQRNVGVVETNLRMYQQELLEVRKVRQQVPLRELLDLLGDEANDLFAEYEKGFAGKDRRDADLQLISDLCDRLAEIGRQMHAIKRVEGSPDADRNFEVVMDSLSSFEREYELIDQARQAPQAQADRSGLP